MLTGGNSLHRGPALYLAKPLLWDRAWRYCPKIVCMRELEERRAEVGARYARRNSFSLINDGYGPSNHASKACRDFLMLQVNPHASIWEFIMADARLEIR